MLTELSISQADRRPMYFQIMQQIKQRVAAGEWQPGQEIPSIRALAVALRVSVITVKRAYLELEREGVIAARQGRGSFVAEEVDLGRRLRHEELDQHLTAAAEVALRLGLTPEQAAKRLQRACETLEKPGA
jgi:GntR family transcriptional regulator